MKEDLKPEGKVQSQEPYESEDSGALETAAKETDVVPGFLNLTPKEDEPDEAEAESSPDKEEQTEEVDEQRTEEEDLYLSAYVAGSELRYTSTSA